MVRRDTDGKIILKEGKVSCECCETCRGDGGCFEDESVNCSMYTEESELEINQITIRAHWQGEGSKGPAGICTEGGEANVDASHTWTFNRVPLGVTPVYGQFNLLRCCGEDWRSDITFGTLTGFSEKPNAFYCDWCSGFGGEEFQPVELITNVQGRWNYCEGGFILSFSSARFMWGGNCHQLANCNGGILGALNVGSVENLVGSTFVMTNSAPCTDITGWILNATYTLTITFS